MRNGRIEGLGPVLDVIRSYESFLLAKGAATEAAAPGGAGTSSAEPLRPGPARLGAVRLVGAPAEPVYAPEQPLELEIEWEAQDPRLGFHVGVGINRIDEVEVLSFSTHADGLPACTGERAYSVRLLLPKLPLVKGEFTIYIFLLDEEGLHIYDQRILRRAFSVKSPSYTFGLFRADHEWNVDAGRASAVHRSIARA